MSSLLTSAWRGQKHGRSWTPKQLSLVPPLFLFLCRKWRFKQAVRQIARAVQQTDDLQRVKRRVGLEIERAPRETGARRSVHRPPHTMRIGLRNPAASMAALISCTVLINGP
jgi:hypothetical protein